MITALLASIVVSSNAVTFTALSTDCGLDAEIEFLFVGPGSDHDYESMFTTEDSVADIAAAFAKIGVPPGKPSSAKDCRFWPVGEKLTMEPELWTVIRDMRNERKQPIAWTGGTREKDGVPVAATNMPLAVFALYNLPQSLMQFDDTLDQGATYGRFRPAVKIPRGEKRTFTFTRTGETTGGKHEMTPDFPPEMTVGEAVKRARIFAELDSPETKVNGYREGQFFYRAFLPRESWKDRKERLTQPYEVRLGGEKPTLTVITEDWSDTTKSDPKLIVAEKAFEDIKDKDDNDTCFIYAPNETKLADVYAIKSLIPKSVVNWYVFGE